MSSNQKKISSDDMTIKVILVGDSGVGKTAYMNRLMTGNFTHSHIHTIGVQRYKLVFYTNHGPVTFYIWDKAGNTVEADAVIGMCDVTNYNSFANMDNWLYKTTIPSVACGNKIDNSFRQVNSENKRELKRKWGQYYDISAKSNYNFEKPFLYLAKKLTGHDDLVFSKGSTRDKELSLLELDLGIYKIQK